jgi:cytochrome b561
LYEWGNHAGILNGWLSVSLIVVTCSGYLTGVSSGCDSWSYSPCTSATHTFEANDIMVTQDKLCEVYCSYFITCDILTVLHFMQKLLA